MLPLYVSKLTLFKYSSFALVFACSDWQKIHHHTTHIQNVPAIALFFQDQWMQWGTARTSVTFRSQGSRKSEMGISRNGSTPIAGWFIFRKIPSRNGWFSMVHFCQLLVKKCRVWVELWHFTMNRACPTSLPRHSQPIFYTLPWHFHVPTAWGLRTFRPETSQLSRFSV